MTGTFLAFACVDDRRRGGAVDRVEHHHLDALGQRGLSLLLLLGGVLVGVRVDDLAARAELLDLGLEQRPVLGLVAGRLRSPAAGRRSCRSCRRRELTAVEVPLDSLLSSLPQAASNIAAATGKRRKVRTSSSASPLRGSNTRAFHTMLARPHCQPWDATISDSKEQQMESELAISTGRSRVCHRCEPRRRRRRGAAFASGWGAGRLVSRGGDDLGLDGALGIACDVASARRSSPRSSGRPWPSLGALDCVVANAGVGCTGSSSTSSPSTSRR